MTEPIRCPRCKVFKDPSQFPSASYYACSECPDPRTKKARRIGERLDAMARTRALAEGRPWPPPEVIDKGPSSCAASLSLFLLRRAASEKVSRRMAQKLRDAARFWIEDLSLPCEWCRKRGVPCGMAQVSEELARHP